MLPAARILLPVSLSVLVVIYKYFRSGRKSEFSEGVEVPPNPTSVPSPAPSDLDLEVLDWIRRLDPAVLNRIRNLDPAAFNWIRNLDPALLDVIRNFNPAFPLEFSESVDGPLNPPSVPSPEPADLDILDFIRTLDPAVLDEIQSDPAYLDEIRKFDPSIVDEIRRLSLKEKEAKEEEKRRECKNKNEKERERESSGGGGRNENGGEEEKKVVEESSRRNQYPLRPEAGDCPYYLKTGNCKFGSNCKKRECEKENEKERERESSGGGGGNENGGEEEKKVVGESSRRNQYPLRPEAGDCPYYLKTGNCKFGSNCKKRECEKENEKERERESSGGGGGNENGGEVEKKVVEESSRRNQYPLRPEAADCSHYLKTGNCKFGSNCKFNHPRRRKNKQVSKDKAKQREELEENHDQTESKYYISPGRRIGVPSVAPALELNFLGLPIRPGEKGCSHYMRTGTCKYETNCKFNHPDPTAAGESRPQSAYGNGRPASLQGLPNSQGINSETTEGNGYQAPAYLPHRGMPTPPPPPYVHRSMPAPPPSPPPYVHRSMPAPPPPPHVLDNSVTETNYYRQYAQQKQAEEFPERPGQPVCFYFAQTGDCINKSNCQYHHPKNHTPAIPSCTLNDRGLPLRPGQNICTQYSRYGLCSSGPTCRFDHPSLSGSFL